jgi:hypothetical protein
MQLAVYWEAPMDNFVKRENIRHYRRMLEQTSNEDERRRILKLLADEEARSTIDAPHQPEEKRA